MQVGHAALAAVIASYAPEITGVTGGPVVEAFSWEAVIVVFLAHFLPNFDVVPIRLGLAKDSFHCTWSHTFLFAILVGALLLPINPSWSFLAFVSLILHYLADSPSSVGLPLLLPFSKKRFSCYLWADTGHSGWFSFKGTYMQSWTWFLEGGMFLVLLVRAYQEGVFPFA
ncbi:MAG: metal-dependent hydrolase [Deltaproteobacteria bacterium]|nr:metal-dependent hydrolase [Deltaproteobacteria bacterium]